MLFAINLYYESYSLVQIVKYHKVTMSARRENEVSIFNVCNAFRTDDFSQRIIELERK